MNPNRHWIPTSISKNMSRICAKTLILVAVLLPSLAYSQANGYWGDQGDGSFRNPIISSDYSDPDPIRVGDTYYMAASTFESYPGLTILESKDLVNWRYSGSVFKDMISIDSSFSAHRMDRFGQGVFAPSMRFHDNKFWVFVNFYTDGFFVATADHPSSDWAVQKIRDKNGKPLTTRFWTDTCPFWDEDGKAYLAASRPGEVWYGYLFQMSPDGTQLLDADVDHLNEEDIIYEYDKGGGTRYSPFTSTEGNKIYRRNGYYYLVHIEFLPEGQGCGTYVMRSRHIYGVKEDGTPGKPGDPGEYEIYKIGEDGCEGIGQEFPGQGGLVDTPEGDWFWIGQFNRINIDGYRVPNLVPVTWIDDWPVFGLKDENGQYQMPWQMEKPIDGFPISNLWISDEFEGPRLSSNWLWNHQTDSSWSLEENPGWLRIQAQSNVDGAFFKTPNVLNVRHFKSKRETITTRLSLEGVNPDMESGLVVFNGGENSARLGVIRTKKAMKLQLKINDKKVWQQKLDNQSSIDLRLITDAEDHSRWAYSLDGKSFVDLSEIDPYQLKGANFRGSMIGLYTYSKTGRGYLDVDWFRTEIIHRP